MDTEDWAGGEALLMKARARLSMRRRGDGPSSVMERRIASSVVRAALLEANNALGVIWTNRSEPERALPFLEDARAAYEEAPAGTRTTREEAGHTQTLFYLAQVLGQLGREDESAAMCGGCLRRQLERRGGVGWTSPEEWAQNAAQLAGFYVSKAHWATARHCVAAAERVYDDAYPRWARKHIRGEAAAAADGGGDASALPDEVADVGANVQLAWGKLHLHRLMAARDLFASRGTSETGIAAAAKRAAAAGDDHRLDIAFPSLRLAGEGGKAAEAVGLVSQGPNEGWIPRDVCTARVVFNAAAPRYRAALSHYLLDGFVTEHCDALLDVSSLHKALAFFEASHSRRRHHALQRRRVLRIDAALAQLSPRTFPGLCKTLWFEVGEAHRAVLESKIEAGRPPLRLASAARAAAEGYERFLRAYDDDENTGQPPERVPEDEERAYLTARFVLARVVSKTHGAGSEAEALARALVEYEAFASYVKRHAVTGFDAEAGLCAEMAELLPTKIDNLRRLEARDASAVDPLTA